MKHSAKEKGSLVILTLVFGGLFVMLSTSLAGYVLIQKKVQFSKENREKALQVAEAGLEYYKWRLAHFPDDLTDGTGSAGPYVHEYSDPEGGTVGEYALTVSGNSYCGELSSVQISSKGYTQSNPELSRTVYAKYARPSVAEFAYVINSNVWAGADRQIYGRYHSNGGIRMDGTNYSTVTSGVATWLCTTGFGCTGSGQIKPGVFGAGTGNSLWKFPVTTVDFAGITLDLATMKTAVQTGGGILLAPKSQGYHLIFRPDGKVDVYEVRSTSYVWAYSEELGWHRNYEVINSERFLNTTVIPTTCPIVFAEDDIWIEGQIKGKVTVVSADVSSGSNDTRVILSNNLTYATGPGTDGVTVIAEDDVLVPLISPNNMVLNGVFIAQKGHFGRNYYTTTGSYDVPNNLDAYVKQDTLTMNGTIVSNGRVGTQWSCGGSYCSGYAERINSYDRKLATDPPPLTPHTGSDFIFVEWRDMSE